MKSVISCGFVAAVLAMSAAAGAQDAKMDDMSGMKAEKSYTGCLERSQDGAFTLAHAMASDTTDKASMMKKSTTKKSMPKESNMHDTMAKDAMAHDSMAKDSMAMAPALRLSSTSADLSKHVGHKLKVKGVAGDTMDGMTSFVVKSIKMVGSSCS